CFAVVVVHEWPDGKNKALKGSIRTPSVPRPISFYALAGRDPEPNTTIRKEEATWSRTSSCRCGSEQFIQKENFPEFTYRLFVLWNRVIYTKLLTHPTLRSTYMKKTWNQYVVKQENKSLILRTIKNHFPISRADTAGLTGLNKGTVSSSVNDLLNEQLIYESGPGKSSGGRRPVMLLFNKV